MLEMTADYVRERRQFGVPVGSFQAVKHHLANARIALEFARPLVYRAAASIAAGDPDASVHVSMAKAKADAAALRPARAALQCHGAIGYTTEYDLHLYMKRAWALARSWGDARVPSRPGRPRDPVTPSTRSTHGRGLHHRRGAQPGRAARRRARAASTPPISARTRSAR